MNKVFLFALQLGVLAPFWRSMQALLWANSGRASEGALWNIVYCGGPLLIACALGRVRLQKTAFAAGRRRYIIHVRNRILICVLWMKL